MRSASFLAIVIATAVLVSGCAMTGASGSKSGAKTVASKSKKSSGDEDQIAIEELEVGSGPKPRKGQTVVVHYIGRLADGTVFDSSYDRGKPFEYKLGEGTVVKGWEDALPEMQAGGKYKVDIPSKLGYGSKAKGDIPANSRLIFEMEMLKIKKTAK